MAEYKVWRILAIVFFFITCLNVLSNMRLRSLEKRVSFLETTVLEGLKEVKQNIESGDSGDVD